MAERIPSDGPPDSRSDGSGWTASWEGPALLNDGRSVRIREIRPDDADALLAFGGRLSRQTISYRLLGPVVRIGREGLREFVEVDRDNQIALVTTLGSDIVATARCVRSADDPSQGEVTFTVEDAFQGRGLGVILLDRIAEAARERGIETLTADVLPDNIRMLRTFDGSGFRHTTSFGPAVVHVDLGTDANTKTSARLDRREHTAIRHSLAPLFEPRTVAVVGASREPGTIGHEILRNLAEQGFTGGLYPVNPHAETIAGLPAHPSLRDVPGPVDLVLVAVPAPAVEDVVRQAAEVGAGVVVVVSTGFGESGPEGVVRERELAALARDSGMRMVGPNCMGVMRQDGTRRMVATFAPVMPGPGPAAMSSQSGPLGLAVLDHAHRIGLGFSGFVSIGNAADVSTNDLLQWWEEDSAVSVILLHLDRFGNPRTFARIARRIAARKPIVAMYAGSPTLGAHARRRGRTVGGVTGSESALDALFAQSGIIRTRSLGSLFDVALLLAHQPVPPGNRVAVITNAGGPGALTADACVASGLVLAEFGPQTLRTVGDTVVRRPGSAPVVDLGPGATGAEYRAALSAALADEGVDSVIVLFIPPLVRYADEVATAISEAAAEAPKKTVLASFLSQAGAPAALRRDGRTVPSYVFPEAAATALGAAAAYGAWRREPAGVVRDLPGFDRAQARRLVEDRPGGPLSGDDVATLLTCYGIRLASPTTPPAEPGPDGASGAGA
ncbi:GNAT family N-acetyltransferase, partial [Frankia canadensis]|uniref:bifunctional acetate--CoA ligase family protein/GNAT family N-acetyltransferase n=1 Tax=Frankia canadensis TaxID=1836972 RepID=UPI000C7A5F20